MIGFAPGNTGSAIIDKIIYATRSAFALAQTGAEVAQAIAGIFRPTAVGTKTLTLGTDAPSTILTTTPTRWITIIEADGLPTIIAGWR